MKIYVKDKKINKDFLNKYTEELISYKLIYSSEGIFKIFKNKIYKMNIIDKSIIDFSINGYNLLIDESIINYDNDITTIPFNHKLKNINEVSYRLDNQISLKILYNNNSLIDYYFETKLINNNIKDSLYEYVKIFN